MALSTGTYNIAPGETAKDVDARRRVAMALLEQGASGEPIQAWTQGMARIAQSLAGGYDLYREDEKDRKKEEALQKAFASLPGMDGMGGGGPVSDAPMASPQAPPQAVAPIPSAPMQTMEPPIGSPGARVAQAFTDTQGAIDRGEMDPQGRANLPPPQRVAQALTGQAALPPTAPIQPNRVHTVPVSPPVAATQARQAPNIPPDVVQKIQELGKNPTTRPLALELWKQYATPKDQWVEVPGPAGKPLAQRNLVTGEVKPYPQSEFNIHSREDGAVVATDKNNPANVQVIKPPNAAADIASFKGAVKTAEKTGEAQGQAQTVLGPVIDRAAQGLDTLNKIREHPGKQFGVGTLGFLPAIPGTQQAGFVTLVDQAQSQAFLQIYEQLRGAGQISNAEGAKGTAAVQRLNRAQNQKDFDAALNDAEEVLKIGLATAKKQASGIPSTGSSPASIGSSSSSVRRYNPKTEKIE